ncbi:MAG: hypothetical protein EA425_02975 [Puniceicoccaceae bacterium]|nr:MAG: hypothetical protein EA425_02975 [Puniceicoccaceae bacterium]
MHGFLRCLVFALLSAFGMAAAAAASPEWRGSVRTDHTFSSRDSLRSGSGDLRHRSHGIGAVALRSLDRGIFAIGELGYNHHDYSLRFPEAPQDFSLRHARESRAGLSIEQAPLGGLGWVAYLSLLDVHANGAGFGDGRRGVIAGALTRQFRDDLLAGLGLGLTSGLNQRRTLFPLPILRWQINDLWSLETRNGLVLSRTDGPWSLQAEALYQSRQIALHRLDDRPDGAMEDRRIEVGLRFEYQTATGWNLQAGLATELERELILRGNDRDTVARSSVRPGVQGRLALGYAF